MKKLFILSILAVLVSSCAEQVTRGVRYAKLYEEKPLTMVVMPPINKTSNVAAKEYFYTTLYAPLSEKGYYVFSPYMTMDIFQGESAYDSEMFIDGDLSMFKNVLNADAAMFTVIKSWKKSVIGGKVTVGIEYILKSTTTNEVLYKREGLISIDTSVKSNASGLAGMLISMASTAIKTAVTEHVQAGRSCNVYILSDLPVGKYNENYGLDKELLSGSPYIKATVE